MAPAPAQPHPACISQLRGCRQHWPSAADGPACCARWSSPAELTGGIAVRPARTNKQRWRTCPPTASGWAPSTRRTATCPTAVLRKLARKLPGPLASQLAYRAAGVADPARVTCSRQLALPVLASASLPQASCTGWPSSGVQRARQSCPTGSRCCRCRVLHLPGCSALQAAGTPRAANQHCSPAGLQTLSADLDCQPSLAAQDTSMRRPLQCTRLPSAHPEVRHQGARDSHSPVACIGPGDAAGRSIRGPRLHRHDLLAHELPKQGHLRRPWPVR